MARPAISISQKSEKPNFIFMFQSCWPLLLKATPNADGSTVMHILQETGATFWDPAGKW
jgi:hypothetical protein